ncbi:MAG: DNA polymerase III subunit delta [Burkholderiaceae bacterium]|jgi:DNA polymerase-3 subunit delta|nr:DNA polymerase III subunit delta [Burkholderiaceae bacterium]MCZ8175672.1 DNA polymerase III subunit delta [Burkholderiaceae bacterium]
MQIRADALDTALGRGLKRLYVVHGDEPLLAQEAADAIRAAARAAGFGERQVFTVAGAHFDWSAVIGAAQAMSLFAERQFIEIRIPSGKPGKDGSEALQRYVEHLSDDVLTLVTLPGLDGAALKSAWFAALDGAGASVRVEAVPRHALPAWLAQRLARQQQRVAQGEEGQRTLAFFADSVEGNLLAAHQELQKLALLHGPGELRYEQVEAAVLNVARYDVAQLSESVWGGQVARVLRMLDGLRAEGEAAVRVHWLLAEDVRALGRVTAALREGRPIGLAMQEARVWGARQRALERVAPLLAEHQVAWLLDAAAIVDGICKGLPHADWPRDPWDALRRWVLAMLEAAAPAPRQGRRVRLALSA